MNLGNRLHPRVYIYRSVRSVLTLHYAGCWYPIEPIALHTRSRSRKDSSSTNNSISVSFWHGLMCEFLEEMSTKSHWSQSVCVLRYEKFALVSVKWEFVDMYIFKPVFELSTELKIENKFENIIRIYSSPRSPSKWSSISLWRNPFGKIPGTGMVDERKKKRSTFEISTVSNPGATRVQHLFSGCGLRIFVTNIESAGNATAHPTCSLNLFYSYSITLGYAFAQWK